MVGHGEAPSSTTSSSISAMGRGYGAASRRRRADSTTVIAPAPASTPNGIDVSTISSDHPDAWLLASVTPSALCVVQYSPFAHQWFSTTVSPLDEAKSSQPSLV